MIGLRSRLVQINLSIVAWWIVAAICLLLLWQMPA